MSVPCLTFNALPKAAKERMLCILCFQPLITAQAEIFPCYVKLCVHAQRPVQWWSIYTSVCLLSNSSRPMFVAEASPNTHASHTPDI